MKNVIYLLFLLFLFFCSCKKKVKEVTLKTNEVKFNLDYSVSYFSDFQRENKEILTLLNKVLNTHDFFDYANFWSNNDNVVLRSPYVDLYSILRNIPFQFQPSIIAIQKINPKKYLVKIAIIGEYDYEYSLKCIYNIYVININGKYLLKTVISDNLNNWKNNKIENITYYYKSHSEHFNEQAQQQVNFENELIELFNFEKINYKYVICKNNAEISKLRGYEFKPSMFLNNYGGETFTGQKVIFAGNNSAFYPHELVHLYVAQHFDNIHNTIDEGLATYLGGARGLSYSEHKELLKKYINNKENINFWENLLDDYNKHQLIDKSSSLLYAGGALICDLVYSKLGIEGLKILMSSGKTDEELIITLEKLLDTDRNKINELLITYLNKK